MVLHGGYMMEASVAINWWVGASEREGHQDLHFFTKNMGCFERKGKVILAHLCRLYHLYSVLDKAGSAKVLEDMFDIIQK